MTDSQPPCFMHRLDCFLLASDHTHTLCVFSLHRAREEAERVAQSARRRADEADTSGAMPSSASSSSKAKTPAYDADADDKLNLVSQAQYQTLLVVCQVWGGLRVWVSSRDGVLFVEN